jgi:iron-regulated transporter 1
MSSEHELLVRLPIEPSAQDELPREQSAQDEALEHSVPQIIARKLYISHFLSTWNSRVFEFGAVLYLGTIYPGNLMPMSIYAVTRGLSAIIFAPAVGQYIDTGNRLRVVRVSIGTHMFTRSLAPAKLLVLVVQRLVVAISLILFYLLAIRMSLSDSGKIGIFVFLSCLACIEKLCSIMNIVSVEKDWVRTTIDFHKGYEAERT